MGGLLVLAAVGSVSQSNLEVLFHGLAHNFQIVFQTILHDVISCMAGQPSDGISWAVFY